MTRSTQQNTQQLQINPVEQPNNQKAALKGAVKRETNATCSNKILGKAKT
jgi:hypothetical protein